MSDDRPLVVLAAGGTAGHVYPAIALADELKSRGVSVAFVGGPYGTENRIVQRCGYPLHRIGAMPFERESIAQKVRSLAHVTTAFLQARSLFKRLGADAVIGFGGYASVAPLLAARSLGLWTAVHEANCTFGLANRYLLPFVHQIFAAFDRFADARRPVRVIGMPVRREIRNVRRAAFSPVATVLVMSGTEPSAFLDAHVPQLLGEIVRTGRELRVFHQSSPEDVDAVADKYAQLGIEASVAPFFHRIDLVYARADVVISRAGASSVTELATCGVPAILVPHPTAAADHQTLNARMFEEIGAVHWIAEHAWNPATVISWLTPLLDRGPAADAASKAIAKLATPDAAATLATEIIGAVGWAREDAAVEIVPRTIGI